MLSPHITPSQEATMQLAHDLLICVAKIENLTREERRQLVAQWSETARIHGIPGLVTDWIDDIIDYYE